MARVFQGLGHGHGRGLIRNPHTMDLDHIIQAISGDVPTQPTVIHRARFEGIDPASPVERAASVTA